MTVTRISFSIRVAFLLTFVVILYAIFSHLCVLKILHVMVIIAILSLGSCNNSYQLPFCSVHSLAVCIFLHCISLTIGDWRLIE